MSWNLGSYDCHTFIINQQWNQISAMAHGCILYLEEQGKLLLDRKTDTQICKFYNYEVIKKKCIRIKKK